MRFAAQQEYVSAFLREAERQHVGYNDKTMLGKSTPAPAPPPSMPYFLVKYFERNFGGPTLNVAHQKVIHYLEACLQYAEYPLVNFLRRTLVPTDSSTSTTTSIVPDPALWVYVELRNLLSTRKMLFLGPPIPNTSVIDGLGGGGGNSVFAGNGSPKSIRLDLVEGSVESIGSFSSNAPSLSTLNGPYGQHGTSNAAALLSWQCVRRVDALACVEEMLSARGGFGPAVCQAIYAAIDSLPALDYSQNNNPSGSSVLYSGTSQSSLHSPSKSQYSAKLKQSIYTPSQHNIDDIDPFFYDDRQEAVRPDGRAVVDPLQAVLDVDLVLEVVAVELMLKINRIADIENKLFGKAAVPKFLIASSAAEQYTLNKVESLLLSLGRLRETVQHLILFDLQRTGSVSQSDFNTVWFQVSQYYLSTSSVLTQY